MNNSKNETIYKNITNSILNINITLHHRHKKSNPLQKLAYYFLILLIFIFITFFIFIIVLLIRKQIRRMFEKMRRFKLQQEINKIMNLDIFETRRPSIDTNISGFHSISNDSSLGEITNSSNILSEINAKSSERSSKGSSDS